MKLSETQKRALSKLDDTPKSAYCVKERLPTLRALVRMGLAKDVTRPGPGSLFSPATHYQFVRAA